VTVESEVGKGSAFTITLPTRGPVAVRQEAKPLELERAS
jgi:hypothetical protein